VTASVGRPRVLLLEDEWLIADEVELALQAAGFDVLGPVGRVCDAMDLLVSQRVDVAVLDINLHGERSFGVAEQLARTATPFVFLSGYSDLELPQHLRDRPLMHKPVDLARLCRYVSSLINP
jgi:DNA-binding response OmpR family regulator